MTVLTSSLPLATPRREAGADAVHSRPAAGAWVAGAASGNYWVRVVDFALLYLMLALGLNIVVGMTGLLDMGFIALRRWRLSGRALLVTASDAAVQLLLQWFPDGLHLSMLWLIPLAALLAAACDSARRADAAAARRLSGDRHARFPEIVHILMRNLDRPVNLTNGPKGISGIDPVACSA